MGWNKSISNLPEKEQGELLNIDGGPDVEEPCIFERGIYLSFLYSLYYVKEISMDMLEEQVSEERDPYLNEEDNTRMEDIREEH